jgi:hypothetical protein
MMRRCESVDDEYEDMSWALPKIKMGSKENKLKVR